jgi:hypothetical protein
VLLIRDPPAYDVHGGIAVVFGMIGGQPPQGQANYTGEKKAIVI